MYKVGNFVRNMEKRASLLFIKNHNPVLNSIGETSDNEAKIKMASCAMEHSLFKSSLSLFLIKQIHLHDDPTYVTSLPYLHKYKI